MSSQHDLVVVGAGFHGLVAAKTYIELHPTADVLVLEAERTCGGTWSEDRLYPGLKSNNLLDTYNFPDLDMSPEVYGVQPGQHIPGQVLHRYLTDYAKKFGVFNRTKFNTRVESMEAATGGGWVIQTSSPNGSSTIHAAKVILATGLTSQPNFPKYADAESFNAPCFHAKDFCRNADTVKTAKQVVVIGGAKSAMDVAYAYADAGAHVDMVIRENGNGPVWISYPWVLGGKKRLEKLLSVRLLTWFSPCPFGGVDGWQWARNLLHSTRIGRFVVDQFWGALGGEVLDVNGYKKHPEVGKLQPWNSAFWIGSGLSIHNYDKDLFEMVRVGKFSVHKAEVDRLSANKVHLSNDTTLDADVLVCATGWKKDSSVKFLNLGDAGIGLPHSPAQQKELITQTDEKLLNMYPRLRNQPTLNFKPKGDPFRLYRFIVPPGRMQSRDLAFAGLVSSVSTATAANAQALWISTYLDGRLDIEAKTEQEITDEVMLHTQWGKWRYPTGYGASLPDFVFDALPYIDLLLKDLGLKINRKNGWWNEITDPYSPRDFVGLVDEWKIVHGIA